MSGYKVEDVLATLATVAAERDEAHLLLRALRIAFDSDIPDTLRRRINGAVALESEGDIARAHDAAMTALLGKPDGVLNG